MLRELLAALCDRCQSRFLRRERKQIKVIRNFISLNRISLSYLVSRKVMRFEGKHSVAADKKIFKNVSERNGSQLFEERLSQTSFIHLVELFITP